MECLGIPIDHRLRRLIREFSPVDTIAEDSDHIQILHEFGASLKNEDGTDYLTTYDLSFGIEMARPATKGGVVVALLQPRSSQDNSNGFLAGKRNCPTIKAVSELISMASNARLGFDDISIFDAIPFLDEKVTGKVITEQAQDMFADMIKAKQPDVVITCFKTNTSNVIVQHLCSGRIGSSFDFDPQGSKQLVELGLSLIRVNSFHPSYAVNYYPEFSCFKRLLIMEFIKAFALWQGRKWVDDQWMANLRHECHEQAKKLCKGYDIQYRWAAHYYKGQWKNPLDALKASFETCIFGTKNSSLAKVAENDSNRLVQSQISWICCDIGLILERPGTSDLNISQQLFEHFKSWCRKSWPESSPQFSSADCIGYYDHSAVLLLDSKQEGVRARKLENIFFTFLRDLNLSYGKSQQKTFFKIEAQKDAFRRFAAAFENVLDEIHEKNMSSKHDLCDILDSLSLTK